VKGAYKSSERSSPGSAVGRAPHRGRWPALAGRRGFEIPCNLPDQNPTRFAELTDLPDAGHKHPGIREVSPLNIHKEVPPGRSSRSRHRGEDLSASGGEVGEQSEPGEVAHIPAHNSSGLLNRFGRALTDFSSRGGEVQEGPQSGSQILTHTKSGQRHGLDEPDALLDGGVTARRNRVDSGLVRRKRDLLQGLLGRIPILQEA